jgi:hypothetical protein
MIAFGNPASGSFLQILETILAGAAVGVTLLAPLVAQIWATMRWIRRRVENSSNPASNTWGMLQFEALFASVLISLVEFGILYLVGWLMRYRHDSMGYLGLFFYGLIWIYGGISLVVVFVFTTVLWWNERSGREDGGP